MQGGELTEIPETEELPFIVVAGASAGGLEALTTMLEAVPSQSGLAFIVVQHLSSDHESMMPELLSRHVDMEVVPAVDATIPRPDTVYVIQPSTVLSFRDGRIRVRAQKREPGRLSLPINEAFESVSAERGGRCALVVLSGTGSDGAAGIRAGKQANALTVAQTPEAARFDGMPRAAIATGSVELILGARDIVPQIMEMLQEGQSSYFSARPETMEVVLPRVLAGLKQQTGIDFSAYKPATIVRRIQRRMQSLDLDDVRTYADRVQGDPEEARHLRRDLLIGVTRFLRDEGAIEAVRRIAIPRLLVSGTGPLRLWVPGCSTGQEAYSMAMLVQEGLDSMGQDRSFKLFATDVDEAAIEQASAGEFSVEAAEQLPPALLARHFVLRGDVYVVKKSLRERLLFSRHDLLQDPPFSRIDMVSCRNLLIYFKPHAQERALRLISHSMRDDAILWLGASESIGDRSDLFEALDGRWKLFIARADRKRAPIAPLRARPGGQAEGPRTRQTDRVRQVLEQIQSPYVPPCLVVDENLRLLYRFGEFHRIVRLPQGVVSLDVRDFLPAELSGILASLPNRVNETGEALYREVYASVPDGTIRFDLRVRRLQLDSQSHLYALYFESLQDDDSPAIEVGPGEVSEDTRDRISTLERELRLSRENLQATIEELESSNEELQATNEELVAANEELQSTNEELQSVNEELHTVNAEHGQKLEELGQLNDDLDNLISSVDVAILFLDPSLVIRRFNTAAARYFHLMQHDEGRPLGHLSHNLDYRELLDDCAGIMRGGPLVEKRVRAGAQVVIVRITADGTRGEGPAGVVITITDITAVEQTRRRLDQLNAAFRDSPASTCVLDGAGRVLQVNPVCEQRAQRNGAALRDRDWIDLMPPTERERARQVLESVRTGTTWRGVLRFSAADGSDYFELSRVSRASEHDDSLVCVGELVKAGFTAYERVRRRAEPAQVGPPSYSLWCDDPYARVIDPLLSEQLDLSPTRPIDLRIPEDFADETDAPALAELFQSGATERAAGGYFFHTRGATRRRRLIVRMVEVDEVGEPNVGMRSLVEVAEVPPGPSGWRDL